MAERIRVGDKTFLIDRSKMSSSRIRAVEREIQQYRNELQAQALRDRMRIESERSVRRREKASQEEARQQQREQTLARRTAGRTIEVTVERDAAGRQVYRDGSTTRLVRPITGAGGVSTTFAERTKESRAPYWERAAARAERKEQRIKRKLEEKRIRDLEKAGYEQYPGFEGRRPSEIMRAGKLRMGERAKGPGTVSDILAAQSTEMRLLPLSREQGGPGGGAVRELHAVEQLSIQHRDPKKARFGGGGAMEGVLTEKGARELGFQRLIDREAMKARERKSQREAGLTPSVVVPRPEPPQRWEIVDPTTGEKKIFKSQKAIDAYQKRLQQASRERQLRAAGTTEAEQIELREKTAFDPAYQLRAGGLITPQPKSKVEEVEWDVATATSASYTTDVVLPDLQERKATLGGYKFIDVPIIGGMLSAEETAVRDILRKEKADIRRGVDPKLARKIAQTKLDKRTSLALPTIRPEGRISRGIKERLWTADFIPGIDVEMTPGTQAFALGAGGALSASAIGVAWTGASYLGGEGIERATGSPGLGFFGTVGIGMTGYGVNRMLAPKPSAAASLKPKKLPKPKSVRQMTETQVQMQRMVDIAKTRTKPLTANVDDFMDKASKSQTGSLRRQRYQQYMKKVDQRVSSGKQRMIGDQGRAANIMLDDVDPTTLPVGGLKRTTPVTPFEDPRNLATKTFASKKHARPGSSVGFVKPTAPTGQSIWASYTKAQKPTSKGFFRLGSRGQTTMLLMDEPAKTAVKTATKVGSAAKTILITTPKPTTPALVTGLVGVGGGYLATRTRTPTVEKKKPLVVPWVGNLQKQKTGTRQIPKLIQHPQQGLEQGTVLQQRQIPKQGQKLQQRQLPVLQQKQKTRLTTPLLQKLPLLGTGYLLPRLVNTFRPWKPSTTPRIPSTGSGGGLAGYGRGGFGIWSQGRNILKGLSAKEFIGFGKKKKKKKPGKKGFLEDLI